MFQEKYFQLKEKLAVLEKKKKLPLGFKLYPRLSEEQILSLEKEYHVSFPQEYRAFLQYFSNGGKGLLTWGIFSIEEALKESQMDGIHLFAENFLEPKSYDEIWEIAEKSGYFDEEKEVMKSKNQLEQSVRFPAPGLLVLRHGGDTFFDALVMNGKSKGYMWTFMDPGWLPVFRNFDDVKNEKGEKVTIPEVSAPLKERFQFRNYLFQKQNAHLRLSFFNWLEQWVNQIEKLEERKF